MGSYGICYRMSPGESIINLRRMLARREALQVILSIVLWLSMNFPNYTRVVVVIAFDWRNSIHDAVRPL